MDLITIANILVILGSVLFCITAFSLMSCGGTFPSYYSLRIVLIIGFVLMTVGGFILGVNELTVLGVI